MGYLAVLMMQRIDLSPLSLHYMLTGMEHSKQVHKHMESIDSSTVAQHQIRSDYMLSLVKMLLCDQ